MINISNLLQYLIFNHSNLGFFLLEKKDEFFEVGIQVKRIDTKNTALDIKILHFMQVLIIDLD